MPHIVLIDRERYNNIINSYSFRGRYAIFYYRTHGHDDKEILWFVDFYNTEWAVDQARKEWLKSFYWVAAYVDMQDEDSIEEGWLEVDFTINR